MGLNPDSPEDESGIKKAAENSECFMAGPYGRHISVVVGVARGSRGFWLVVVFFMNNVNVAFQCGCADTDKPSEVFSESYPHLKAV